MNFFFSKELNSWYEARSSIDSARQLFLCACVRRRRPYLSNDCMAGCTASTVMSKRGSSLCTSCGCSNGNRADKCKECNAPLSKRAKLAPCQQQDLYSTNVTEILPSEPSLQETGEVYSVRIRSSGPEYRLAI